MSNNDSTGYFIRPFPRAIYDIKLSDACRLLLLGAPFFFTIFGMQAPLNKSLIFVFQYLN